MLPLTKDVLLTWAHTILSDLAPALLSYTSSPEDFFSKSLKDDLNHFFARLSATTFTRDLVRTTQIHTALMEVAEPGGGWPDGFANKAEIALRKMEKEVGGFRGLGTGLWDEGGRLEGCQEVQLLDGKRAWVVEMREGKKVEDALVAGDLGFRVGSWWLTVAAAIRDGIISCLDESISADAKRAYAILVSEEQETSGSTYNRLLLRMTHGHNRLKLMKSFIKHQPIRVLRHYRLQLPHAPRGGVRYDGLYFITDWSVKLNTLADGSDQWAYTATMSRAEGQEDLNIALNHPTSTELKDWDKFLAEREEQVQDVKDVDLSRKNIEIGTLPENDQEVGRKLAVAGSVELLASPSGI